MTQDGSLNPTALLPCPFCGSIKLKTVSLDPAGTIGGTVFIECTACGTTGPNVGAGPDAARQFWNKRAATPTEGFSREDRQDFFESKARVTPMPLARHCPFCGHSSIVMDDFDSGLLICEHCDAAGPNAESSVDSLALWNTRAS